MIRANATRGHRTLLLAAFLLTTGVLFATPAQAASPGWEVLAVTGPTNLPPAVDDEVQTLTWTDSKMCRHPRLI